MTDKPGGAYQLLRKLYLKALRHYIVSRRKGGADVKKAKRSMEESRGMLLEERPDIPLPSESEAELEIPYGSRNILDYPDQKEALVLIHLSSLDSFGDIDFSLTGNYENTWELAYRIVDVIEHFKGPIFIGDQQWTPMGLESRPRQHLLSELERLDRKDITFVLFDEQNQSWDKFLYTLLKWLHRNRITKVSLGGLFWAPDLSEGCVTHTYKFLKEQLPVKVLEEAVGEVSKEDDLPSGYTRGSAL